MLGLCETENGTNIDELQQAGASGHKRVQQDAKNEFRFSSLAGSLPRKQDIGRLKDRKEGSQGSITENCGMSSEAGGLIAQKGLWNVAREKMLQERERERYIAQGRRRHCKRVQGTA